MKLKIVSVFDKAAAAYNRPMFVPAVGQAVRSFTDEINKPGDDNVLFHHPTDFELYELGTFDDSTGHFEPCTPTIVITGGIVKFSKE